MAGHTDNDGTAEMNQKLSEDRANNVKNFLIQQGVPASKIRAFGFGFSKPKASNDSEEGKALNRRVEIVFTQ